MADEIEKRLTAKLALEAELVEPLGYAMSAYIETWVRSDGQMRLWDQTGYRGMIERVLLRHYARTISVMSGVIPTDETNIDQVALGPAHAARLKDRAYNQALHMVRGIERDLASAMADIRVLPIGKSDNLESKKERLTVAIAARFKETAKQAWAKLKSRLKAIATLETESVSEEYSIEWVKQKHANSRIYKNWNSLMDGKERPWHHDAHNEYGDEGIPVNQPFIVGGEELMQPGDASRGASLANLINCFPGDTRISGAVLAATRHWFEGDVVEVVTRSGNRLAGTPNHPVLTPEGWIALGALDKGDDLIRARIGRRHDGFHPGGASLHGAQDVDDVEPTVQEVFDALAGDHGAVRHVGLAVDFHGDVPTHDVNIVRTDRVLWHGVNPAVLQRSHKFSLGLPDLGSGLALSDGLAGRLGLAGGGVSAGDVGGKRERLARFGGGLGHPSDHALASVPRGYADISQGEPDLLSADAEFCGDEIYRFARTEQAQNYVSDAGSVGSATVCVEAPMRTRYAGPTHPIVDGWGGHANATRDLRDGHAALVKFDRVVEVRRTRFSGHVYNLQTMHGIYHANGFVVHNCRCHASYYIVGPNGEHIPIPLQTLALPARRTWRHGDRLGIETPVRPTESITMTGRTRANVVLGDGRTFAVMQQVKPDTIVVRVGGRDVARATFSNGVVTSITLAAETGHLGLEELIRRSVSETAKLRRAKP